MHDNVYDAVSSPGSYGNVDNSNFLLTTTVCSSTFTEKTVFSS